MGVYQDIDTTLAHLALARKVLKGSAGVQPKLRAALAKARNGTANARIAVIGDSTSYGAYPVGSTTKLNSWVTKVADRMLAELGVKGGHQSFFGSSYPGLDALVADPRITISGSMSAVTSNLASLGGNSWRATSAGTLNFLPTEQVDTFEIWYVEAFGASFTHAINGGSTTTVGPFGTGTNRVKKITKTVSLGNNTLNLAWAAGNMYIVGIEAYNSAVKQVSMLNMAWFGSNSSMWITGTSNPWDVPQALQDVAPDLTIIGLGINDNDQAVPLATSRARLQTLTTAALTTGDVTFFCEVPTTNVASAATQTAYWQMAYELAALNGGAVIDVYNEWGASPSAMSAVSAYSDNFVHPNALGQSDVARIAMKYFREF